MFIRNLQTFSSKMTRYLVNDGPGRLISGSYNAYSMLYRGQLSLGLPVSKELIVSRKEIKTQAVQKLALVLYHMFLNATRLQITRDDIKAVIHDELKKKRLRLTENVILLTENELTYIYLKRFKVPKKNLAGILEIARRRRIIREALRVDPVHIYFDSEIEEKDQNGRGDYETVRYRNFTEFPVLKQIARFVWQHNVGDLNFLVSPENHKEDKHFIERYFKVATESILLGLGFQCVKAIYSGQGFKRMDGSGLNYSECLDWFPDNIPIFHFWGTRDSLVPL